MGWLGMVLEMFSAFVLISSFYGLVGHVGFGFGLGLSPLAQSGSGFLTGYGYFGVGAMGLGAFLVSVLGCLLMYL